MYTDIERNGAAGRAYCTLCGREIGAGAPYWAVNGALICEACLPEFARQDYAACQAVRGREDAR